MSTPVNGIYVLQGVVPSEIAAAPVGVKVVDIYDDTGQLFTPSQVALMHADNSLLLGYFNIGEAEDYRSYFSSLPLSLLGPVDPDWPGNYEVAYWTDTWKAVCTYYLDQMLSLGYSGAYFDVVGECETEWAKANAPGGDPKGAMVDLIRSAADYAREKNPNFKIWVNSSGAEELMTNSAFVDAIDGAFEEDLLYQDGGTPRSASSVDVILGLLNNLLAAGKPVVAIEYVTGAAAVADIHAKAAAAGIGSYIAHPNLGLVGVNTEGFPAVVPCYVQGTRILTVRGEIPIEELAAGDMVPSGIGPEVRRVRWIGHRRVALFRHPRPWDVQPVRIRADAFAPGQPRSDLRLSPDHAVLVHDVLIPIRYLINGTTVLQENEREVTYFHVELEDNGGRAVHDVVWAQGLLAESYLDTGNRAAFANGGRAVALHPDFTRAAWQYACRPLVLDGPAVEDVRVELLAQATTLGYALTTDPCLHLMVDGAVIEAERVKATYSFRLPSGARDIRLVSRTTIPAETQPDSSDRRRLGVAVTRLVLDGTQLALDAGPLSSGWLPSEGHLRWTTGSAVLAIAGLRSLEVTIARLGTYWIRDPAPARSCDSGRATM